MGIEDLLNNKISSFEKEEKEKQEEQEKEREIRHYEELFFAIEKDKKQKEALEKDKKVFEEFIVIADKYENLSNKMVSLYNNKKKELFAIFNVSTFDAFMNHPEVLEQDEAIHYWNSKNEYENQESTILLLSQKYATRFNLSQNTPLSELINSINKEIFSLSENIKQKELEHPETRKQIIEQQIEDYERHLPSFTIQKDKDGILFSTKGFTVSVFSDEKIRVNGMLTALVSHEKKQLKELYSDEEIGFIEQEAYRKKIDLAFHEYDNQNTIQTYECEEFLKENNRETLLSAVEVYKTFKQTQEKAQEVLRQKSQELKEKGIIFSERNTAGTYGGTYEEVVLPLTSSTYRYNDPVQVILKDGFPNEIFPPKYNYKDIQTHIEKRIADIEDFIKVIEQIESNDDIEALTQYVRNGEAVFGTIQYFHKKTLDSDPANVFKNKENKIVVPSSITTISEAEYFVQKNKKEYAHITDKVLGVIEKAISFEEVVESLIESSFAKENKCISISNIEDTYKRFERRKKEAQSVLLAIETLVSQVGKNKEVRIESGRVIDTKKDEIYSDYTKKIEKIEGEIQALKEEHASYDINYKKLSWFEKISINKEEEKKKILTSVKQKEKEKQGLEKERREYHDSTIPINETLFSFIKEFVQGDRKGTLEEVAKLITVRAEEVQKKDFPEEIKKLLDTYNLLKAELYNKV